MQKVLLINPEESRTVWTLSGIIDDEPLDVEMIYTELKNNNIEVYIYDVQRDAPKKLINILEEYTPTITYINGVHKQVPFIKEYNHLIKEFDSNIKTIVGGNYAEHNYEDFFGEDVDYIARSYEPSVITNIVRYIQGEEIHLEKLNGLCYKDKEKWIICDIKPVNIEELPIIRRDFFNKHKEYFKYLDIKPVAHISKYQIVLPASPNVTE